MKQNRGPDKFRKDSQVIRTGTDLNNMPENILLT